MYLIALIFVIPLIPITDAHVTECYYCATEAECSAGNIQLLQCALDSRSCVVKADWFTKKIYYKGCCDDYCDEFEQSMCPAGGKPQLFSCKEVSASNNGLPDQECNLPPTTEPPSTSTTSTVSSTTASTTIAATTADPTAGSTSSPTSSTRLSSVIPVIQYTTMTVNYIPRVLAGIGGTFCFSLFIVGLLGAAFLGCKFCKGTAVLVDDIQLQNVVVLQNPPALPAAPVVANAQPRPPASSSTSSSSSAWSSIFPFIHIRKTDDCKKGGATA